MTDTPITETEDEPGFVRCLDPEEAKRLLPEATESLKFAVSQAVFMLHDAEIPSPLAASAEVFKSVMLELQAHIPVDAVRQALLIALDASYPRPVSFMDIGDIRSTLVKIASIRRARMGERSLIIPGVSDQ